MPELKKKKIQVYPSKRKKTATLLYEHFLKLSPLCIPVLREIQNCIMQYVYHEPLCHTHFLAHYPAPTPFFFKD